MEKVNAYYLTENDDNNVYAVPELLYEATAKATRDNPRYWEWMFKNGPCYNSLAVQDCESGKDHYE